MLEQMIISYCAPTLAGMKTANLFSYQIERAVSLESEVKLANEKLNPKGVFVYKLKEWNGKALLYVYRREKLIFDLSQPMVQSLLKENGYDCKNVDEYIERLALRVSSSKNFPHEIGAFLNYPIQDVLGFIEQKGKNFKISGLWKVYDNENEAIRLFAKFKKCTEIYSRVFANGRSLSQLTVAA